MAIRGDLAGRGGMPYPGEEQVIRDTAFLSRALESDGAVGRSAATGRPVLVVLTGLPGTGKSHFARELTQQVPLLVVGSDRIRKLLVSRPKYTPGEHSRLFAACHHLIENYLDQGCRVLYDATNLTGSSRRPLYRICERLDVPLVLVRFTAPRETVRRRLVERAARPHPGDYSDSGWLVYCRLSSQEEPIGRRHYAVGSSGDIAAVLTDVARLAGVGVL